MVPTEKIRVLQVTGGMDVGGAETWLMHVLRGINSDRFQFDFLIFSDEEQAFEAEILQLGACIVRCSVFSPQSVIKLELLRTIRRNGPYDVIHCHVQHFSGVILAIAKIFGIPIRIVQSHLDSSREKANSKFLRRSYFSAMETSIRFLATDKLAVSEPAGSSLFGENWCHDSRARLFYCGIDLTRFSGRRSGHNSPTVAGLERDAWVVGHAGRFHPQKNHEFIVNIAERIAQEGDAVKFLLLGDGPDRERIEALVKERRLDSFFVFAGVRDDAQDLMMDLMDVFILPSLYEGLPLVGMEAQAAGLPSLFSSNCTRELAVVDGLCEFLPVDDPDLWAKRILDIRDSPSTVRKADALNQMEQSPFNIDRGIADLERLYSGRER